MKKIIFQILMFSFVYQSGFTQDGKLSVIVESITTTKGHLSIELYNKEDGFRETKNSIIHFYIPVKLETHEVIFKNLSKGDYAIAIFHDENNNKEIDLNFLNIPTEGCGFSNNPQLSFGPATFKQAKFHFDGNHKGIKVTMKY